MLLTDLLEAQDAVGRLLASFLTHDERLRVLTLSHAVVRCSFRCEFFALGSWRIPPVRWLAHQVLREFSMKNEVTSVILSQEEWQQPLLHHFPALRKVKICSTKNVDLMTWYFPVQQITELDLGSTSMNDFAALAAFPNLEAVELPWIVPLEGIDVMGPLTSIKRVTFVSKSRHLGPTSRDEAHLSILEKLPNLTELNLCGVNVNLDSLNHLKRLEKLDIRGCLVNDLQLLQTSASTLKSLVAPRTRTSTWTVTASEFIAAVSSLVNLRYLELVFSSYAEVAGLASLSPLVNLISLDLGFEKLSDLSTLAPLTELKSLKVCAKSGTDWSPIANMKKLESLDQRSSDVQMDSSTAWVLASLPSLRTLLSPVALSLDHPLPQVRNVTLTSWNLKDTNLRCPLNEIFPNIKTLQLDGCFFFAELDIANLKKLIELVLVDFEPVARKKVPNVGSTVDFSPIAKLCNLRKLELPSFCNIKEFHFLEALVKLRELDISGQTIPNISVLANMEHMEKLDLSDTSINDISPLGNLRNLRELSLDGTKIKDLSWLRGLPNLTTLTIPDDADFSTLVDDYGKWLPSIRSIICGGRDCIFASNSKAGKSKSDVISGRAMTQPTSSNYFQPVRYYF